MATFETTATLEARSPAKAGDVGAAAAPQASPLNHHNHRFRIDFSAAEAEENGQRLRVKRDAWYADQPDQAVTADNQSDSFLLAALSAASAPCDDRPPCWRHRRRGMAVWLASAAAHICALLVMLCIATPRLQPDVAAVSLECDLPPPAETLVQVAWMSPKVNAPPPRHSAAGGRADSDSTRVFDVPWRGPQPGEPQLKTIGGSAGPGEGGEGGNAIASGWGPIGEVRGLFGGSGGEVIGGGEGSADAEFFGVGASGDKFVFVVDSSLSMKGARFAAARRELIDAIDRLGQDKRFYVIFFDSLPRLLFDETPARARFVSPTDEIVKRLEVWTLWVELGPETEPLEAVKLALGLKPDAMYLLTDGEFRDKTALYLRLNNRIDENGQLKIPATVVHTIGFQSKDGQALLQRIAKENGGVYRFVE